MGGHVLDIVLVGFMDLIRLFRLIVGRAVLVDFEELI